MRCCVWPLLLLLAAYADYFLWSVEARNTRQLHPVDIPGPAKSEFRLDVKSLENGYHALVKENETLVEVTPPIRAIGGEPCNFRIVNKHHGPAPFVINHISNGYAELRATKSLNCEKRRNYKFDFVAVECKNLTKTPSATVHITVSDVNEYAPTFLEPSYVREVDEGRIYSEIVRVEARDRDCTPKFGDICKYEILTADQPFVIDMDGVIRNTERLDYERSHNHILSVVAYDCGMRQSLPVMVTIKVLRVCRPGWRNVPERVDCVPGTGKQELFPAASLELCHVPCNIREIRARIDLTTRHIGKGCDRDTYSVQSQRKLCGASPLAVDLLPAPGIGAEWTKPLISDEGHESDQMFEFDGTSTAVTIPNSVLDHRLPSTFTISTWMRHSFHPEQDKHVKEHILCAADDHKMNRHHYALFVRNCRLILLLRRDFSEGDLNIFRPAEWRWKLGQVCDDNWHHYSILVQFPNVQLYVDGQQFHSGQPSNKNPEIIDDWPLHPTKDINTTLTVGACWQGSDNKMKHHLKGYLAGLSVVVGDVEKSEVLSCLHKCKEGLEVPAMELLRPGMEIVTNSEMTELTIVGDNRTNMEMLLRRVAYTNSREFPTPGRRNVHVTTTLLCDNGRADMEPIPDVQSYVMVLRPQTPTINLTGTPNMARRYDDFREGVRILADVRISSMATTSPRSSYSATDGDKNAQFGLMTNEAVGSHASSSNQPPKLDKCSISIYPNLNSDHEMISVPEVMLRDLGMAARLSKDGVTITGTDIVFNYQQVLRQITYTNRKPAYYLNRVFKLACSEMNGRFTSNEYVQTLTVIHPQPKDAPVAHASISIPSADEHEPAVHSISAANGHHHEAGSVASGTASATAAVAASSSVGFVGVASMAHSAHSITIIVVICVGFLVFMVVMGALRIRSVRKHHLYSGSTTTTTTAAGGQQRHLHHHFQHPSHVNKHHVDDDELDDDDDDDEDEDDDEMAVVNGAMTGSGDTYGRKMRHGSAADGVSELAWDDSALTITVNPIENAEQNLVGAEQNAAIMSDEFSETDSECSSEDEDDEDDDDDDHNGVGIGSAMNNGEDEHDANVDDDNVTAALKGGLKSRGRNRSGPNGDMLAPVHTQRRHGDYQNVSQLEWDNSTLQ